VARENRVSSSVQINALTISELSGCVERLPKLVGVLPKSDDAPYHTEQFHSWRLEVAATRHPYKSTGVLVGCWPQNWPDWRCRIWPRRIRVLVDFMKNFGT